MREFLAAIFLALTGLSSPLTAAAATPDPAGFDILGMKLGMSVAQIEAAIRAHDPALVITLEQKQLGDPRLGAGKFVQVVQASRRAAGAFESLSVLFTVTQPGRAFYIGRFTTFAPGSQPLAAATEQQLRAKYGAESSFFTSAGLVAIDWAFDNTGKQLTPKTDNRSFQACSSTGSYGGNFDGPQGGAQFAFLLTPAANPAGCGVNLQLTALPSGDMLQSLDEQLEGKAIAAADIASLMAEAAAAQQQQRQQQEQNASRVRPAL